VASHAQRPTDEYVSAPEASFSSPSATTRRFHDCARAATCSPWWTLRNSSHAWQWLSPVCTCLRASGGVKLWKPFGKSGSGLSGQQR
jgi:hypothetical protein